MPGSSNYFLPPSAHSFNTFDTTELQNALESYEYDQVRYDQQYSQLEPLAEAAAEESSPAITSDDTIKTPTSRDAIKLFSRSRSHRRSKKAPDDSTPGVKRCHLCGVTETPRWRGNSVGAGLLCNVCGLVQTKRISRKNLTVSRESTSTRSSGHR
ncbi:uncharacterized protein B0J16DRAFT_67098 [Fusarium flagelliforme]|uniref:uncharacterized protein n=1 Tax=Fusarium flagelliforme TaxID=2675880 RepID=UPI001E8DB23A|nr:uncharacterized protein B0J16DRAFT_67098 [Fusarium flagelliforme]KAH7192917.1 hypothetical protein B0J16DRAFT_67098 [Fusarium flagelliforme]